MRWKKETLRSFKARVDIPGRGGWLLLQARRNRVHEMEIELQGQMQPVLRMYGQATPAGRLQDSRTTKKLTRIRIQRRCSGGSTR